MPELLPNDLLQQSSGTFGVVLATWIVWPVLCGALGARRGEMGRGIMNGVMWGPIGLVFVLLSDRKYLCPTCGKKTLKHPPPEEARPVQALNVPLPRAVPIPSPTVEPSRRAPVPMSKEEREKIVVAACAGYDNEEEARLRSWLNNE